MFKCKPGISILEILIVIVIIGILAALAVPGYERARENAVAREARASLKLIAAAEKIYSLEEGYFYPDASITTEDNIVTINSDLKLQLREDNWDYTVSRVGGNFAATANRISGSYDDCIYSIDQDDRDAAPVAPADCP